MLNDGDISFCSHTRQSGVALLQVLMIGMVISMLAIGFSETAKDQTSIALDIERRVTAELKTYSAINEAIFLQLSETVITMDGHAAEKLRNIKSRMNFHGEKIAWRENTSISIQDLNGLLPQLFPGHVLWRILLEHKGLSDSKIDSYLGVWQDTQDPDARSWIVGDMEPPTHSNGYKYLDGFAQTEHIIKWVFEDDPLLSQSLRGISNVRSPSAINPFNSPTKLLSQIFEAGLVDQISALRTVTKDARVDKLQLLPKKLHSEEITTFDSPDRIITASYEDDHVSWTDSMVVSLRAKSTPPFIMLQRGN